MLEAVGGGAEENQEEELLRNPKTKRISRKGVYRIWRPGLEWFKVVFQSKKLMGIGHSL